MDSRRRNQHNPLLPEGRGDVANDGDALHPLVGGIRSVRSDGGTEDIVEGIWEDVLPLRVATPINSDPEKEEEVADPDFSDLFGDDPKDTGEPPDDGRKDDVKPAPSKPRWPIIVIIAIGVFGALWYKFGAELKFAKSPEQTAAQDSLHHDALDAILFALESGNGDVPCNALKTGGSALVKVCTTGNREVLLTVQIAEGELPAIPWEMKRVGSNVVLQIQNIPGLKGNGTHDVVGSYAPVHAVMWNETELTVQLVSSGVHYNVAKDGKAVNIRFWN